MICVVHAAPAWGQGTGPAGDGVVILPYRSPGVPGVRGAGRLPPSGVLVAAQGAIEEGVRTAPGGPFDAFDAAETAVRLARIAYSPNADADRKVAREKLMEAYDAWFALEVPRARRLVEEASGALERTPQTPQDLALLSDLRLLAGMIELSTDAAASRRHFDSVVRLTPGRKLDPRTFPPHVATALAQAEDRLRQTPVAQLNVETTPDGVALAIDGVDIGRTPRSLDRIAAGEHFYRLEREGLQPKYGRIELEAGDNPPLRQFLPVATADELAAPVRAAVAENRTRPQAGAALATLFGAERVLVASIAADGPRRYSVEMWWADAKGDASTPVARSISAEPAELARGLIALTHAALTAAPGDRATPVTVDAAALAGDVGMLAAGRADLVLKPPPTIWYRRKTAWAAAAGVIALGAFAFVAREAAKPGKVDYNVTLPENSAE